MYVNSFLHPSPIGEITVVRLENSTGSWVELSSLGAGIRALCVPDRTGTITNVALAYADPADYMADGPCMGKTPGRYANRIAGGRLAIDGREYSLPVNNGPNHLHGGPEGFQNRIWETRLIENGVEFSLVSPDGEMGYPGTLRVTVSYTWSEDCRLTIRMTAETDAPTVVNLTNHTYWNLRGADTGSALDHLLTINASRYLTTDADLTPDGNLAAVEGTPMDFRQPHAVGERIKEDFPALRFGKGYDNCWALDGWTEEVARRADASGSIDEASLAEAVVLADPETGRRLTVETDQPGVQVYTGNWLAGSPKNRNSRDYADYDGIAIEAQGFPDAPNHPGFPSQRLDPGHRYARHIVYRFDTF